MPLKLKSFSQPDRLKRFQPGILSLLLEPFRHFFEMRGFSLPSPDGGEVDLPTLAGILAEPDEEMPSELVEGLHLIEHLGTTEYYDDLLQLAAENGIDPDGEATAPDLAVQVWLKNPQALERKDRNSDVQMELDEGPSAHDRFDRISRSTIGSPIKVHHRVANSIAEEVAGILRTDILELFDKSVAATGLCSSHGEIEIPGGARCLEPEFHCVAALQNPFRARTGKEPGKEPVKCDLSPQALQIDSFFAGNPLETLLQCGAQGRLRTFSRESLVSFPDLRENRLSLRIFLAGRDLRPCDGPTFHCLAKRVAQIGPGE